MHLLALPLVELPLVALLPLQLSSFAVPLLIGLAFGFVLESSGFGDSRRLAAQFYFTELRVLKVMFTAIITCMLLLAWCISLGWLDADALFVNPTYLASGILGGVILGFGFIIGGYCPGTSLVSAATFKIDGLIFVGGVSIGVFVFGETADGFRVFFDTAGAHGRLTLPDWMGLPLGFVVLLLVLMALFMFWGGEILERVFGPRKEDESTAPRRRIWRPAVRGGGVALVVLLVLAVALPVVGEPSVAEKVAKLEGEMRPRLEKREVLIDPVELLGLMHTHVQGSLGRFRLLLVDVRSESDFNLFHLVDAKRIPLGELESGAGRALRAEESAIVVLLANDENEAVTAWKSLYAIGLRDHYVLAGGINLWLDVFRRKAWNAERASGDAADGSLRHTFEQALGNRYPYARPPLPVFRKLVDSEERSTAWKVKALSAAPAASGGCG